MVESRWKEYFARLLSNIIPECDLISKNENYTTIEERTGLKILTTVQPNNFQLKGIIFTIIHRGILHSFKIQKSTDTHKNVPICFGGFALYFTLL